MVITNEGNLFDFKADIWINAVNCIGVMGKGVALEFRKRFPEMFYEYRVLCDFGFLTIGKIHVWQNSKQYEDPKIIINFPTKIHWKNDSKYEWIEEGLNSLRNFLSPFDPANTLIAMPALGCGNGNLEFNKVLGLIKNYFEDHSAVINVFAPK